MDLKTALVTGTSSGIGKAIAQQLLESGYHVVGVSRTRANITHDNYEEYQLDLLKRESIEQLYQTWKSHFKQLDLLVHSAGIGNFSLTEEASENDLVNLIDLNLRLPILLSRKFLRTLLQGEGQIIFINSIVSTYHSHLGATYAATKAGLLRFAQVLFEEHRKHGLRCLSILPGIVDTPFYRSLSFGPTGKPEDQLLAQEIATIVDSILTLPPHARPTHIEVPPQCNRVTKKPRVKK